MKTFKELIDSPTLVLVHFTASWCVNCGAMSSVLSKIEKEHKEIVRIIKIDVDKNRDTTLKYSVQTLPTLLLFKKGRQLWRQIGVINAEELTRIIEMFQ